MPIRQQQIKRGIRANADVVFCIDASGSMSDCIEGVKKHIDTFARELASDEMIAQVKLRLGLIAYDDSTFSILKFTDNVNAFRKALKSISPGVNEPTLPAMDWALDFEWNHGAHRIVVVFTDEPLETGWKPDFQRKHLEELLKKIQQLRVMVYFVGPDCKEYRRISQAPRCIFEVITEKSDFYKKDFQKVLERISRSISISLASKQGEPIPAVSNDIYSMKGLVKIRMF